MKVQKSRSSNYQKLIKWVIPIVISILAGYGFNFVIRPTEDGKTILEASFSIELADKQLPALITNSEGETEQLDNVVTVDSVDGNQLIDQCIEKGECGLGDFVYAPTDTPQAFKDYTIGKCWDLDNFASAQCWDLGQLYWQNYSGRNLSTCGTGMAKGIWNCKEQNAGSEFELITEVNKLQAGDWLIFSGGKYGHVGMAMGEYNNGYIALLGQNQGGKPCEGGGSSTNIINMSLNTFIGAFRPKSYIKTEPEPEPVEEIPISGCVLWHVKRGDTMSRIMLDCEGTVVYGEAMDNYAKSWYSLIYKPNQSVYDGWNSKTGVGLYAGDDIEHRTK